MPATSAAMTILLRQMRRDALARIHQALHGLGGFLEHATLGAIEMNLHDALDALGSDHRRHADIEVLDSVFAVQVRGAGQDALLVLEIALRHRDRGRRGRIKRRAALEQVYDLSAAVSRALQDGI